MTPSEIQSIKQRFGIIGNAASLNFAIQVAAQVAPTDMTVLITGESGSGKESFSKIIHALSPRKHGQFIAVNCGAIPEGTIDSELFGHEKGSFTGATEARKGYFEVTNGGTIFLDEIGELDLGSQVKLLRVLQDRTYEVLGDSRSRSLDIRVICATNRDLAQEVREGRFREDLFYRINLITVRLPALRERPDDIPLLAQHFVQNLRTSYLRPALKVNTRALHWLREQPLPGNIRELKNLVERAVLVSGKDELGPEDFQAQAQRVAVKVEPGALPEVGLMTLDEMEAQMIRKTVDFYAGNLSRVAKALGLSRGALYRRLEKFNIPFDAAS